MARTLPVTRLGALQVTAWMSLLALVVLPLGVALIQYGQSLLSLTVADLRHFVNSPGLIFSITFTLVTAIVASFIACYVALAFSARAGRRLHLQLAPLLALPHVAFAIGVLFLFSPNGWWLRALHAVTGWFPQPPESALLADKSLFTLIWILLLKEIPFLLLMISTSLAQMPVRRWLLSGQSLGHSELATWWHIVVPELLRRLTLPMAAVIIYTLSVVDIPLLVGPNVPPTLAQRVFQWFQDFSSQAQQSALIGSLLLVVITAVLLWLNRYHADVYRWFLRRQWRSGTVYPQALGFLGRCAHGAASLWLPVMILLSVGILTVLVLWSFAFQWFYPALWPQAWTGGNWVREWPFIQPLVMNSLWLALASASIALVAAATCLEYQARKGTFWPQWLLILALLVPQLPLVMSWQFGLSRGQWSPHWLWLLWAHSVFAFPYAYLVLLGDYRRFNRRWLTVGQTLGYSPARCWWQILVPMLKRPILYAWVIAFSVSIAQYLPTQLLGAGRLVTITTEAVNVGSGGDRRLLSLYALWQFLLPFGALLLAWGYLAWSSGSRAHQWNSHNA